MASIRKRKDRPGWLVDYFDATGRRRRLTVETREQAEQLRADKVKESRQAAPAVEDPNITLTAYAERWQTQIAASVAPRTAASYAQILRLHILPAFGRFRLRDLHRGHIKALLAQKRTDGLSKNSVRLIRAALSVLLGDAVEDGLLAANPVLLLERRSRRKRPDAITQAERRKHIRPLTYEQLATFLAAAEARCSRRDLTLFLTMADTGLRPGEALALQWEDFDAADRTLRVERAVSAGHVRPTKTDEARRVDLTRRLVDALNRWQAEREADALINGRDPSLWIFHAERSGELLDELNVAKRFRALLRAAGLPRFRLYDLRHTYATHLLTEGAPITYVAAQLGHAKPTTTLMFYAHWLPSGDKGWVDRLARAREAMAPPADQGKMPPRSVNAHSWHQNGTTREVSGEDVSEVFDLNGAGGGT